MWESPTVSNFISFCITKPRKGYYRYDKETITFLLRIKWWNNSVEWFHENWELLCDIDKLEEYYKVANR